MQKIIFKPQTEWLPPEEFPDLSKYDEKQLQKRKGQLDILNWILTLKQVSQETFDELENEKTI